MGLSQTSVIFFYILAGFVIYITAKGQLGAYLNIALGQPAGSGAIGQTGATTDAAGYNIANIP